MSTLVTGGAGYIGAHVVRLLREAGEQVVVVDDLSTGAAERVGDAVLESFDLAGADAAERLQAVIARNGVEAVIHFAAKKQVGESVERPSWYFRQNVGGLANVLDAVESSGVTKLVFSSSAAVYGMPEVALVDESVEPRPINPYGETKLVGEWMLRDAARAFGLRVANLRYFNVAGAGWEDLGDPEALNLVTIVFDRMRRGEPPLVYGDDYPTADGSGIRDYVHVLDLARAHIDALGYLDRPDRPFDTFNVGTGEGASVHEVIGEIARASGRPLTPEVVARRAGDPPQLVADATRITGELGWAAEHDLASIVDSAWAAEVWRNGAQGAPVQPATDS